MAERMDHEKMRKASELPVSGPAASDTTAASGGLDLPGRAAEGITPDQQRDLDDAAGMEPPTVASIERERRRTEEDQ